MPRKALSIHNDDPENMDRSSLSAPPRPSENTFPTVARDETENTDVVHLGEITNPMGNNRSVTPIAENFKGASPVDLKLGGNAVIPGAVAVHETSSQSNDSSEFSFPDAAIVAKVVAVNEDIEDQVEERFRQRAGVIADEVMHRLRENVVDAAKVEQNVESDDVTTSKHKRRLFIIGCSFGAVLVGAVVAVVVLLVVTRKSSPSPITTRSPTLAPTQTPATKAPTLPPPTHKIPLTLKSNHNETVLQLVDGALDHMLLAQYLNVSYNSDLAYYLAHNEVTLFAPTDKSFQDLQYPPYEYYFNDPLLWWENHLYILLATHAVPQNITSSQLVLDSNGLPTVGTSIPLTVNTTSMTFADNGAKIEDADIQASNGYIQVPDRVLLVRQLRDTIRDHVLSTSGFVFSDEITKFRALLEKFQMQDMLAQILTSGFSLFVPMDSAFDENITAMISSRGDNFTKSLLMYHMLNLNINTFVNQSEYTYYMSNTVSAWLTTNNPQGQLFVNSAQVLDTYTVQNGFLHLIDQVLVPPDIGELLQLSSNETRGFNFSSFESIVNGPAHLGSLLAGHVDGYPNLGSYGSQDYLTVFAPLEGAFADLSSQQLNSRWLEPSWLLHLQNVVLHHFTVTLFPDAVGPYVIPMLSGYNTNVQVFSAGDSLTPSNKTIDGIQVYSLPGSESSDLIASDGLIYVMDELLLPPWVDLSLYDQLVSDTDLST